MKQTFHPVKSYGSPFILALDILFILNPKRGNVFFLVKLDSIKSKSCGSYQWYSIEAY